MSLPSIVLSAAPARLRAADRSALLTTGLVTAALALLVVLMWLPFGWNVGFTGDDWIYYQQAEEGSIVAASAPTRLLIPIPWLIGYHLDPAHFAGINGLLALVIFGKGVLVYAILRRLRLPALLAFAASALTLALPADSGIFYMGGLHNQFALVCLLAALYLLLVYWQAMSRWRLLALVGMGVAQIVCVGISEQVYPLIAAAPLILLVQPPRRRWARAALCWYVVPIAYSGYYLWIMRTFPRAFAYQGSLIDGASIPTMLESLARIYARLFVTGWVGSLPANPALIATAVIAGGLVIGVGGLLARRENQTLPPQAFGILAASGLVIVGLAVVLYLPTTLRDETLRTFLIASIGAAVTLTAVGAWLLRRPIAFAAAVGFLAAVGMVRLLDQHQGLVDETQRQQAALIALVRALPDPQPGSGIVVIDESPGAALITLLHAPFYVQYLVPLLYGDSSLEAEICAPAELGWEEGQRCRFTATGMTIPSLRQFTFDHPYSQLIVLRYDGTFTRVDDLTPYTGNSDASTTYRPAARIGGATAIPARAAELLGVE